MPPYNMFNQLLPLGFTELGGFKETDGLSTATFGLLVFPSIVMTPPPPAAVLLR